VTKIQLSRPNEYSAKSASTEILLNSIVLAPMTQVFKKSIQISFIKRGFWILNLIQIFGFGFKKKFKLVLQIKWIWIQNLLQLFISKMDLD